MDEKPHKVNESGSFLSGAVWEQRKRIATGTQVYNL